jgi:hypothetical protein
VTAKEETKKAEAIAEAETMTGTGPEQSGQRNAATLEEAMVLQDKLARERNGTTEDEVPAEAPEEG